MGEIERYYKDDLLTREREGVIIVIEHKGERKRATVFKTWRVP